MSKNSKLTLDQLELFHLVCEQGSLTRAAAILDMAQPSVSRRIRALESALDVKLLHRTGRGITPTAAGERLNSHAKSITLSITEAQNDIRECANVTSGVIKVGVTPMVSQIITGPLASKIKLDHPFIKLQVLEGLSSTISEWITCGEVDLAVMYKPPSQFKDSNDHTILLEEPLCLICGDKNRRTEKSLIFSDATQMPLVLPSRVNGMRRFLDSLATQNNSKLNVIQEIDSYSSMLSMTRCGGAVTILPMHSVQDEIEAGFLTATPITKPSISAYLSLYVAHTSPMRRANHAVVKTIENIMKLPKTV